MSENTLGRVRVYPERELLSGEHEVGIGDYADYYPVVRDRDGRYVEGWHYTGFSPFEMVPHIDALRRRYPKSKGYRVDW